MSSKVDDRIVNMKFNNSQFEKGVSDTSKSLESLKKGLDLKDAGKGISGLAGAFKNFSLDGIASGVETIASKFSALSVVGITALANIANKAVDAGITIMKSLTIDPVKAGFDEYELKMGSIQTILANTSRYGTSLSDVTANLDELNAYADKTIYNFGDMTKNIGLFTNAGIRIEDATSMIKGFSNAAAASGTSSQGAAGAAYQLSQALSAGTIRLMDWRSLTNVGMGNKNMQTGLIEIADAMGTLEANSISATDVQKDFNGSLEKNWLSADVMSSYLKVMAEDNYENAKAMALSIGLSEQQADVMAKQAVTANEAATKVRTWTQLIGTLQEGVGSGWAQTFDILIGDFDQATELWSSVNDALGPIIGGMSDARNDLLSAWAAGGGRDSIITSVANAWNAAVKIIGPIKEAFQEIFPPMTAQKLIDITKAVEDFTKKLMPSEKTVENIKSTFKGLFAVLDIGWMILKQVGALFLTLFRAIMPVGGGVLEVTGNIGDFLVKVRDAIKNGDGLAKTFKVIGDILVWPIEKLKELGAWTREALETDPLGKAWEAVGKVFEWLGKVLAPVGKWLGEAFTNVKDAIKGFFETMDFNVLVGLLNVGALAGVGLVIKKLVDAIKKIFSGGSGGGLMDTIKGVFGAITDTFSEMQNTLKAASLIGIGVAIALITASVVALSFVDTQKMFIALGAITVMFGQLSAMLVAIDKLTKTVNAGKMIATSVALGLLAGAILIMSSALLILSTIDLPAMGVALGGMAGGLAILVGALKLLDKVVYKIGPTAAGLILLSTAVVILASAMKIYSTMSWDDILRSMTVMTASIAVLVAASALAKKAVAGVPSMILMSLALTIMSGALKIFATMSWDDILRSMTVMAASIAILVGAVAILSTLPNTPVGAATMLAMAAAMVILSAAVKVFATMSWDEIGRSLVMLAGSLAILAGAMALMGIPIVALGGVALLAVSAGLMMLAPALALLGTMSWDAIGRGLTMLGASLAILAVGGLLLIPASVGFLLLGSAMLLIGTGAFLAGAGMTMFAAGFLALTGAAALGSEAIKMALLTLISLIPQAMAAFAQGIIDFALVIANGGVEFTAAMTTLLTSLITAIGTVGPQIINTLWDLLMLMVAKLEENVPIMVDKGMKLITGILTGIGKNIGKLVDSGTSIIVNLLNGLSKNLPRIVQAGINLVISFINSIAQGIRENTGRFIAAGNQLFRAIVDGVAQAIENGGNLMRWAGQRIGNAIIEGAKNALGINSPSKVFRDYIMGAVFEGVEDGEHKNINRADSAGQRIGDAMIKGTTDALANMADAINTDVDMSPTIKPVLDLSAVKKDASLVGGMLTPPSLKLDKSVAYVSQAQMAGYAAQDSANEVEFEQWKASRGTDVTFIQNNNSPKALSNAEIYRKTNNQLSVAKKELTTTDA